MALTPRSNRSMTMKEEIRIKATAGAAKRKRSGGGINGWAIRTVAMGIALVARAWVLIYSALAVPQPVLTIAPLGSNQFNIVITNGVSGTNYTLFWTPALADENYPWQVWGIGGTNFVVDGEGWPNLFFKVLVGSDSDGDGVTEERDANSNDPTVGVLSVTINSPTN